MERNLKDYIQYYIGCRCLNTWFAPDHDCYNAGWQLMGYVPSEFKPYYLLNDTDATWTDSIKPILRRIESLTDEEKIYFYNLFPTQDNLSNNQKIESVTHWLEEEGADKYFWSINQFHYLLKQGFDLFNLIENQLAIDEKELTPKTK